MKLSINWLNKFLSLDDISIEEVAHKLTMGSFEVEEIHKIGHKLKGPIVIGKVLKIEKHPNADRLSVTKVTTDGKNQIQIVCGAQNIKEGYKVPVSLPGAVVVNRQDGTEFSIKITKIRGIDSFGMLCSPQELQVQSGDPNGILILDNDAKLGENVIDYLSLHKDTVLEIAPRSNRGDALSVYGLSKEISALTGKSVKEISFKTPNPDKSVKNIKTKIENKNDTNLFFGVTIENISVLESPKWLRDLLESIGIRAINNIVDITNYINFTFGQPLHAYDKEKLQGCILSSRLAKNGEKIYTLDGKLRELNENILVIADEKKPVAIAGIMGGIDTEVTENTKTITLEAAVFNPKRVRRGSRTCGLTTEASKRFERGVDSNITYNALVSSLKLIEELASTTTKKVKIGEIQQAGDLQKKENKVRLEKEEITRVLGINLELNVICKFLNSLQFTTKEISNNSLEVTVPSSRVQDVTRSIDLIEEIARLLGYDRIPSTPPPLTICADKRESPLGLIKNYFLASGFSETYLSSLVGEQILKNKEFPFDSTRAISMINPLSIEHSTLRQSLIPGLVEALKLNQSHKTPSTKFFEIGKVYYITSIPVKNEKETGVKEELKLAGICSLEEESWLRETSKNSEITQYLFFRVKGILESFLTNNKCNEIFTPCSEPYLHKNLALTINLGTKNIGVLGCLHPELEKKLDITGPVVIFEINLEDLLTELQKPKIFEKISSQPIVIRDITVDLHKSQTASDITMEINKIKSNFVLSVILSKVYEPDKETKSLTYRLKMQDFEQTLTSEQVENEVNKIKNHLTACFQAKFRV